MLEPGSDGGAQQRWASDLTARTALSGRLYVKTLTPPTPGVTFARPCSAPLPTRCDEWI